MENLEVWYKREVQSWRTGASICWTLISLPLIFAVYVIFTNFHILHPVTWITDSLSSVLSSYFLFLCVILIVVTAIWCVFTTPSYTVVPDIAETRLHKFLQLLTFPRLIHLTVCLVCGALTVWVCSCVAGESYAHLSVVTHGDQYILNEGHLFLIVYGVYSGLMFFMFHYLAQNNYLQFSLLQQSKYFHVRSSIVSVLLQSCRCVLRQTLYYYILYWLFGHIPKDWITYNLRLGRSQAPLDSVYNLLDIGLFWQTFLTGVFLHFTWSFGTLLYKVYTIEHFPFVIESAFEEHKNQCLVDALSCESNLLIKHLGFLDLNHLSQHSYEKRRQVFSLSQPGGHPHNWNKLSNCCLVEIDSLNQKVQDANWKVFASAPVRQLTGEKANVTTTTPIGHGSSLSGNLTSRNVTNGGERSQTTDKGSTLQPPVQDGMMTYLKKKPLISYFLTELPDASSRKLFSTAQIQVWAVEALSNFATASYSEDKYGVVQRKLTDIITAIINLHENVEKHFKLASTVSRKNQKDTGTNDALLRYLLQTRLKSSIYKIVNAFGKHITNLHLSADTMRKLKQFMEYRE